MLKQVMWPKKKLVRICSYNNITTASKSPENVELLINSILHGYLLVFAYLFPLSLLLALHKVNRGVVAFCSAFRGYVENLLPTFYNIYAYAFCPR